MPQAVVKFSVAGAKLTIETGLTPIGAVTAHKEMDIFETQRDSKGNLIRAYVYGLHKLARSGKDRVLASWEFPELKKAPAKKKPKPKPKPEVEPKPKAENGNKSKKS